MAKHYCIKCGTKLSFATKPLGRNNICIPCFKESFREDIAAKMEAAGKPGATFRATYIGGHGAYPKPKAVKLLTYSDRLEVPELRLTIPYNKLQNVQSMTEEKLKASRIFLVGLFAFAWKKRKDYLVITFTDEIDVEQNPVFDVAGISAIQPLLYQQMVKAKTLEPVMPQTVSQPVASADPMEKLAKLKSMLEADLITEEEYNAKKAEILAEM
jgi:hypothetical protein